MDAGCRKDQRRNPRSLTRIETDPWMDANPYAPPTAIVADREPDSHGLKRRNLILMIVLVFVTLGVYCPVWYIRRRRGLNRLDSPRKLALWPFVLFLASFVLGFFVGILQGSRGDAAVGPGLAFPVQVFQLAVGILIIIQSFKI